MAAQVESLLRNPEFAERRGNQAYATLISRFLWKDRVHDYIEIYEGRERSSPVNVDRDRQPRPSLLRDGAKNIVSRPG
jgi:hypothetical protein